MHLAMSAIRKRLPARLAVILLSSLSVEAPLGAPAAAHASGAAHLLIIAGAGGEPRYTQAFTQAAMTMAEAARRSGVPDSQIVCLIEAPSRATGACGTRSTRENVTRTIAMVVARVRPDDRVLMLLIGHGSGEGPESRINLPGPDLTAADFARLLRRFRTQRLALIDATSASGDFIPVLSAPNRVIITATSSSFERNVTMFGRYFVAAYAEDGADVDKDGRVSLLEAFDYARREVARAYERENRLLTEHALLDDDGDGKGSPAPDGRTGDGLLARTFWLGGGAVAVHAAGDPRAAALLARKDSLEGRIATLRQRKGGMDSTAYARDLEQLLLELATTDRELRTIAGGRP
jgi:hypothetical protein